MHNFRAKTAWLMLAPVFAGILVFFVVPFIIMIRNSFMFAGRNVGFKNYTDILASASFRLALGNTAKFVLIGVVLNMTLSFMAALALRRKFASVRLFRSVILFPMFLPVAAVVTIVGVFFDGGGLVNWLLNALGAPAVNWLSSGSAFYVVLGLYIFKSFGYSVVLMLAGMQMIPLTYYEIARIEGARELWSVFRITLPLLTPTLFFTFLVAMMNCFRSFRDVFVIGGNHPHDSIYMLPHFINNNIQNLNYPRLAVASILTLAAISVVTLLAYRGELVMEKKM